MNFRLALVSVLSWQMVFIPNFALAKAAAPAPAPTAKREPAEAPELDYVRARVISLLGQDVQVLSADRSPITAEQAMNSNAQFFLAPKNATNRNALFGFSTKIQDGVPVVTISAYDGDKQVDGRAFKIDATKTPDENVLAFRTTMNSFTAALSKKGFALAKQKANREVAMSTAQAGLNWLVGIGLVATIAGSLVYLANATDETRGAQRLAGTAIRGATIGFAVAVIALVVTVVRNDNAE